MYDSMSWLELARILMLGDRLGSPQLQDYINKKWWSEVAERTEFDDDDDHEFTEELVVYVWHNTPETSPSRIFIMESYGRWWSELDAMETDIEALGTLPVQLLLGVLARLQNYHGMDDGESHSVFETRTLSCLMLST